MSQTRLGSLVEALVNTFIGFGVSLASALIIYPLMGIKVSMGQNLVLMVYFTIISIARSYALRRWFNARIHRALETL